MTEPKRGRGRPIGSKSTKRTLRAPKDEIIAALLTKLVRDDDTGCLIYQGTPTATGHATFYHNGAIQGSAHRVAYEVWKGTVPPKGYVLQSCGNKLCCEPDHLYLASFEEIMRIRTEQGRSIAGSRNPKVKLTQEKVDEIRRRSLAGERLKPLSEEFGVSQPTISQIKNGNIWKSSEPEPE
jgi:hypothetical protein